MTYFVGVLMLIVIMLVVFGPTVVVMLKQPKIPEDVNDAD